MVQGTKPFQGMSRKDFFHHVVHRHFRPPVDPKWPPALSALIVRSWDPDQLKRPTAREYVIALEGIMDSLTHARHRRNSTGTSASGGSGLARVRSMLQMMKERAEDYVVGAGAGGNGGDRRRSSVVAATAEQPQQQQQAGPQAEQQQAAAQRRSSSREQQQQQQPQAAPVAPTVVRRQPQPQPQQVQAQVQYADGKVAAAAGAPDGGGQLHGEGEDQDGHKRRASF